MSSDHPTDDPSEPTDPPVDDPALSELVRERGEPLLEALEVLADREGGKALRRDRLGGRSAG